MGAFIDLSGQKFGRLHVMARHGTTLPVRWQCRCACGATCTVEGLLLRDGRTKSCGCLRRETTGALKRTHGMGAGGSHRSPEYRVWLNITQRCHNPKSPMYPHYGARGITVCDRWRESFPAFYADMGPRPQTRPGKLRDYSLERINNDGPYAPENCRWADYAAQSRNRSNNRPITWNGETHLIYDWDRITGLQIRQRLNAGWSIERAFTTPAMHHHGRHH